MDNSTFSQVERLVDQLSTKEQARLLASLARRMAGVAEREALPLIADLESDNAWAELVQVGESLAAHDDPDLPTLTSALVSMRR